MLRRAYGHKSFKNELSIVLSINQSNDHFEQCSVLIWQFWSMSFMPIRLWSTHWSAEFYLHWHSINLHVLVFVPSPSHCFPLLTGAGLSQALVDCWTPSPHVVEQEDQSVQSPHPPSPSDTNDRVWLNVYDNRLTFRSTLILPGFELINLHFSV